ncbi:MAG: VWA domain-containing protein [Desulfobacteraceae bacterium]|nr:VWA domain-containing protein [Desulfobacteraceae bacterium]
MFRFASPYWFFMLLSIPAVVWYRYKKTLRPSLLMSSLEPVSALAASWAVGLRHIIPVLKYTAICLMIVAMARPQWGTRQTSVITEGINIVLAVDLSESMAALDFKQKGKIVNRLEAVKGVVRDFVAQRTGDRIGMVVFGDHAYTQLPLTRDYNAISFVLDRLRIGAAGKSTAIGDALGISLKRIADIESESNVVILLTDGRSNSGEITPSDAAKIARQRKVKVYTIGVGTRGKAPFLVRDVFGERYVYQRVDIDEDTLKSIAADTGGLYFRAEDIEGLHKIYQTIDDMERTDVEVKTFAEYNELYLWLLLPALCLAGVWMVLTQTRFLRLP